MPTPRLSGIAILIAVLAAGAIFLPWDVADAGDPRRRGRDLAGRHDRRPHRPAGAGEAGRADGRRDHPRLRRGHRRRLHAAVHRWCRSGRNAALRPAPARRGQPRRPRHRDRDRRDRQRDQPDRRRRRARGRGLRDQRDHPCGDRPLARSQRRRRAGGDHRRRRARLPPPRLPSRVQLHGRHRLEPARLPARRDRGPGGAEDERRGRPRVPPGGPRRADPRHELRARQAAQVPAADLRPPTAPTSTTASPTSASASGARSPTCTRGRRRWRPSPWRCDSSPTRTTAATSTPAGRR